MEPVTVLTAGAIAKIAFEEFAKAGGGELAKKSLGGAIDSPNRLSPLMSIQ